MHKQNGSSSSSTASSGIGLGGVVFLVFLVLKLAEIGVVASWSWWWVTSPLWIPLVLVFGGVFVFVLLRVLVVDPIRAVAGWFRRRRAMEAMMDGDE